MYENESPSDLIGDIYDTALDPALWADVIERITVFAGGQAGGLASKKTEHDAPYPHFLFNLDPHYMQLYWETYGQFDPLRALSRLDANQIVNIPDLLSYDGYRRTEFYQDWSRPQGWVDSACVVLDKSAINYIYLNIIRSKSSGMVDDEMRRRLAIIAPHARRALLIGKSIESKQSEVAVFADTLNGLSAGMVLVDAEGQIVHTNVAGSDMLYANDFLRSIGGRLATRDRQANQTLQNIFSACAKGDAEGGANALALALTAHDGECYVAHVLPLTSGARRGIGVVYTAVAAVFVRKAVLGSPSEVIAQIYKLTPTELRVLHSIVEVGGVRETAEALGIGETTVKTHLYRLFDKAGISRQADLVKLVAGFSSPLVS